MKATGSTTKPTAKEHIFIWTELDIKVNGERINSTVMELRLGPMALVMKEIMNLEKNTEQVLSSGPTALCT